MAWLVPLCVYPLVCALYLGGSPLRLEGGSGPREVLGLVLTFVLLLVAWGVLRPLLGTVLGGAALVIVTTIVAGLLLPLLARAAFRVVGVRVVGRVTDVA